MKAILKKILPSFAKDYLRRQKTKINVITDFVYDYKRYINTSASVGLKTRENMQAFLIKEYHAVEKGLALHTPRVGFGKERIIKLIAVLSEYITRFGKDNVTDIAVASLKAYKDFDLQNNEQTNPVLPQINVLLDGYKNEISFTAGGTKEIRKADILATLDFDYKSFVRSRYSTRDFAPGDVDRNILMEAVDIARFTPSVCNRQAWKVFIIDHSNPELKTKYLGVQNGNKGFGESISSLLIVTGKLSSFFSYERNQVYIDGGMFAMSLVLALHSQGLGVCCLNTSYTAQQNDEFKKVMQMDEDCVPIMFLGVGYLKDKYRVAVSERKAVHEIVSVYN